MVSATYRVGCKKTVNWDLVDDLAEHWAESGDKIRLGTRDWK
jgi:hypothetical protein